MPLWDEYGEQLKSNFADVANVGGREAGAVTAASFLSKFASGQRWAIRHRRHRMASEAGEGRDGRPVGLLCHTLLDRAGAASA